MKRRPEEEKRNAKAKDRYMDAQSSLGIVPTQEENYQATTSLSGLSLARLLSLKCRNLIWANETATVKSESERTLDQFLP